MEIEVRYLTKEIYIQLGGTLTDDNAFNLLEYEVEKQIDKYTFGRLVNLIQIPQEVTLCAMKLNTFLQKYIENKALNNNISSENVGKYSVSYGSVKEAISSQKSEIKEIINTYLSNTKVDNVNVLYRGL